MKCHLSVVLPCFNEEKVIRKTYEVLIRQLSPLIDRQINSFELIFVDDGSSDSTFQILQQIGEEDRRVKILQFSRNFGHQAALLAGYDFASGDQIVTLDADLQDPPELIETMLAKSKEGFDIVYAARRKRDQDTWFKRKTAHAFYGLMNRFGVKMIPDHAEFRLVSRRALRQFSRFEEKNMFIRGIFPMVGFPSCIVLYDRPERAAGETKYPLRKMIEFAINGMTSLSVVPLRLCSFAGFGVSLISLALLLWSVVLKIAGESIPGWTSTVAPLYLLGGVQLIFLGVVGEYIGKIYLEVKGRPGYIVCQTVNLESKEQ